MPDKDKERAAPLEPIESDKDLYHLANLRRDKFEMKRFTEAVIQDAERLKTEQKKSKKK